MSKRDDDPMWLKAYEQEISRFRLIAHSWSVGEQLLVLFAWMGTDRIKAMNDHLEKSGWKAKSSSHLVDEAVSQMGMVRWLVTLLAMLADVPLYASERVEPPGRQRVGTQIKPLMDFHRLSIKLPKLHAIKYVERRLDKIERQRKRAHEVRTHWRTYLVEKHCTRDTHSWEYAEDGEHRTCARCHSHSTLIKEHVRGDEKLGWVRKEYVLEPNRHVRGEI